MNNNLANATTPPKPEPREMDIFDENQALKLIFTAKTNDDRNLALYHLALITGMRQGELLGRKWRDIDWGRKNIKIQRQLKRIPGDGLEFRPLKTKSSNRTIAVGEETISMRKELHER